MSEYQAALFYGPRCVLFFVLFEFSETARHTWGLGVRNVLPFTTLLRCTVVLLHFANAMCCPSLHC